ncbi:hypothetical protein HanPSC8_Chr03g0103631 [Helianthus annuus]|nr:hypothetical protein HanPSC8_Chr03g0103631 [Helianthus annuus]
MVLGEDNGLSVENFFAIAIFDGVTSFEPGLVENVAPGSCNRRIRLLVSCQNLADTTIPLGPLTERDNPKLSCTPDVLPDDTLSVSEVRSDCTIGEPLPKLPLTLG